MLEKELYQKFKYDWNGKFIKRIEPKGTGGIPDLLLVNNNNAVLFVEQKAIDRKFTRIKKIPIRQSQLLWFMGYPAQAYILLAVGTTYFLFEKTCIKKLYNGVTYEECKKISIIYSERMKDLVKIINTIVPLAYF